MLEVIPMITKVSDTSQEFFAQSPKNYSPQKKFQLNAVSHVVGVLEINYLLSCAGV